MSEEAVVDKKTALLQAKAKREEEREKAWEDLQTKALELEEEYEGKLGAIKSEFDLVLPAEKNQATDGIVVVKRPEPVMLKKLKSDNVSDADVQHSVLACVVFPKQPEFLMLAEKRAALYNRCLGVMLALAGAEAKKETGK